VQRIRDFARRGGSVLGICGGYQMMGMRVCDPQGLEGRPGETEGLGLLAVETELKAPKTTTITRFAWDGTAAVGYEIHMGRTRRIGSAPWLAVTARNAVAVDEADGTVAAGGRFMGTYIHGLFDTPAILARWLAQLGLRDLEVPETGGLEARDRQYDRLAGHLRRYVDLPAIMALLDRH
jgi:adenosylcobyric acid synthase